MKKDLTGQRFGSLVVVGISEISRNGHYRYHVRCDCGNEKTIFGTHMIQGHTRHCGCQKRAARHWQGCGTVSKTYWQSIRRGAAGEKGRKPVEFSLTIEYCADLLDNVQGGRCALTGVPITISDKTASLDRIDSSRGYAVGNVQWLHKDVNMMKRHYTQNYFVYLCWCVASNQAVDIA